jgi:hypothetical protein
VSDGSAGDLVARHGSARHPARPIAHQRPAGASDELIAALGKLSEALEVVEHARGHLYAFHRLSGRADLTLQEAVRALAEAGAAELAEQVDEVLVGRDVVADLWTFQIVEAYDRQYWSVFREVEQAARRAHADAAPHVFEAEMKQREQSAGTAD